MAPPIDTDVHRMDTESKCARVKELRTLERSSFTMRSLRARFGMAGYSPSLVPNLAIPSSMAFCAWMAKSLT